MIDLHVHSTFSDGSLTPEQLVARARDVGLSAMALTDHDCAGGIDSFMAACRQAKPAAVKNGDTQAAGGRGHELIGIPGIEISADVSHGTMHVLAYFIDHKNSELDGKLTLIREGRRIRNEYILRRLNDLGFRLTLDDVSAFAGEDTVGRPHFAQALTARGYVASKKAAFDLYLAKGKPAYVDRFRLSPEESIAVIRKAGGVPVLSHPFTLELSKDDLREYAAKLKGAGLEGIEAYYPEHSPSQQREYLDLARDLNIVATGGSDFHGEINPAIRLGKGFGSLNIPDCIVEELRMRHSRPGSFEPAQSKRMVYG